MSIGIELNRYKKKVGKQPIICHLQILMKDLNSFYKHEFKISILLRESSSIYRDIKILQQHSREARK